ncbi:MAG: hypothetical protein ACI9XK_005102 [Granulosicoccus sp.]
MDTNDYTRRIRYALKIDDADAMRLIKLGGDSATLEEVRGWRMKEGGDEYLPCPEPMLLAFLNGLVIDHRGPPPNSPYRKPKSAERFDNNTVLKQLRIALSLRTDDVHDYIQAGGGRLGKTEVGAFFRNSDARNYRRCGDQVMRWFLAGLTSSRDTGES